MFSGLTGQVVDTVSLVSDDRSEMVATGMVAGNYFDVLGVQPHLGRLLSPGDSTTKNSQPVAVLQYDFWQTRFGGKPEIHLAPALQKGGSPEPD